MAPPRQPKITDLRIEFERDFEIVAVKIVGFVEGSIERDEKIEFEDQDSEIPHARTIFRANTVVLLSLFIFVATILAL